MYTPGKIEFCSFVTSLSDKFAQNTDKCIAFLCIPEHMVLWELLNRFFYNTAPVCLTISRDRILVLILFIVLQVIKCQGDFETDTYIVQWKKTENVSSVKERRSVNDE